MKNLFGLTLAQLQDELVSIGQKKFRAAQMAAWIYQRGARSFDAMTDLSKELRRQLSERYEIRAAQLITRLDSPSTAKFLLDLNGSTVECVLMRHDYGNSICISSQAGCAMGCAFCASTLNGLERNLTAAEMIAQVIFINDELRAESAKVDSIVVMGMGEPLMNFDNLIAFLRLIHEPYTLGMSYRRLTVSTCGIVPKIYELAQLKLPITLSISLHAPTDELRSTLMPINRTFGLDALIKAGRDYGERTGRRVTYEYILIDGVNDSTEHARQLATLLKDQLANVNVIPINPVVERDFKRPPSRTINAFMEVLEARGIGATLRKEFGAEINAACGQLRRSFV
ncbi:MAG: 23S rRNA (adenine(2503)-C(2))-methyltransferase RlmN [Selenomonadaceae bacterium]|nr:23S rRNA (adenine(2503)-C(2))-methyltransferase RlmN [Selenomonadaceae bacterium]